MKKLFVGIVAFLGLVAVGTPAKAAFTLDLPEVGVPFSLSDQHVLVPVTLRYTASDLPFNLAGAQFKTDILTPLTAQKLQLAGTNLLFPGGFVNASPSSSAVDSVTVVENAPFGGAQPLSGTSIVVAT